MKSSRQSGDGKIGLIIFLLVIAGVIFFCVKFIPPKINISEMKTFTDELAIDWAMSPGYYRFKEPQIKKEILDKAEQLNLSLTEKQIKATKAAQRATIEIKFDVPIDFVVYTHVLKVDHKSTGGL